MLNEKLEKNENVGGLVTFQTLGFLKYLKLYNVLFFTFYLLKFSFITVHKLKKIKIKPRLCVMQCLDRHLLGLM